ncbi:hypothetical protein [Lactobacillus terrae]|uniref:hypothetical protein n=1 Tax=Lactobacillus terrae TaxID=2269374 RepID=UPI000C1B78A0|nr:hypothetical protein [Lactobacillus terrae]
MNKEIQMVGLLPESKQKIESGVVVLTAVREKVVYEDGNRTDKTDGFSVRGIIIDGELAGKEISIKVDSANNINVGNKAKLKIEDSKVYARSQRNTEFATVELSLTGSIALLSEKGGN